jgi:hypothetical protein
VQGSLLPRWRGARGRRALATASKLGVVRQGGEEVWGEFGGGQEDAATEGGSGGGAEKRRGWAVHEREAEQRRGSGTVGYHRATSMPTATPPP